MLIWIFSAAMAGSYPSAVAVEQPVAEPVPVEETVAESRCALDECLPDIITIQTLLRAADYSTKAPVPPQALDARVPEIEQLRTGLVTLENTVPTYGQQPMTVIMDGVVVSDLDRGNVGLPLGASRSPGVAIGRGR